MSAYERILRLLDDLSWQEQLGLISVIAERLRQTDSEPQQDLDEEEPHEDAEGRRWQPRLREMIEWGVITPMEDTLYVAGHPDQSALLLDAYHVAYQGKRMPINEWARSLKGWKSINIYEYVVIHGDGRTLDEIRQAYMQSRGMD
jgi:hypothetical protein